jgi:hypothetical protein
MRLTELKTLLMFSVRIQKLDYHCNRIISEIKNSWLQNSLNKNPGPKDPDMY